MSLRELYQEMILDHGRTPRNFKVLPSANHTQAGFNPVCGDQLTVYLLEQNGLVVDLSFEGVGCAISMASASLMTEALKGKTLVEVEILFNGFHELITKGKAEQENLGKLSIFGGLVEFPARVKCATLAWHTLKAALHNEIKPTSTE